MKTPDPDTGMKEVATTLFDASVVHPEVTVRFDFTLNGRLPCECEFLLYRRRDNPKADGVALVRSGHCSSRDALYRLWTASIRSPDPERQAKRQKVNHLPST